MMRHLVRSAALLLLLALAGLSLLQEELRFVLAGAAISCLVEIGLALRARRGGSRASGDRSRVAAVHMACQEQDGAMSVALVGARARGAAPYVLLSRQLAGSVPGLPYLELSDRQWSLHGGIQEAVLSPGLLRLELDPRGAEVLGAARVCVTLEPDIEQRPLERSLRKILRGVSFTSERSMPEDQPSNQRSA
ncbi:MAG TPA: hypothetical protein VF522_10415 [Ramlibacter sp.]|uniref:hypothetical protein n=1 Tax=Ramlibacter sp. TaxID=1917967 RepID=UPI002ED5D3A9